LQTLSLYTQILFGLIAAGEEPHLSAFPTFDFALTSLVLGIYITEVKIIIIIIIIIIIQLI